MTAGLGLAGVGAAIDAQAQVGPFPAYPCPPDLPYVYYCDPGPAQANPGPFAPTRDNGGPGRVGSGKNGGPGPVGPGDNGGAGGGPG